jgi:hypothetical protein
MILAGEVKPLEENLRLNLCSETAVIARTMAHLHSSEDGQMKTFIL